VVINKAAMDNANIPAGMKAMGDWHVMFQQKNGMLLMWASRAPMDQLKQVLVARIGRVRGLADVQEELNQHALPVSSESVSSIEQ
jgi:hypothetical protein